MEFVLFEADESDASDHDDDDADTTDGYESSFIDDSAIDEEVSIGRLIFIYLFISIFLFFLL